MRRVVERQRTDGHSHRSAHRANSLLVAGAILVVVLFALLVIGGYFLHWRWTGLSGSVTLWDWLQVLALPIALGAAPIMMRHRRRLHSRHLRALFGAAMGFAALVIAGYLVPVGWTGFTGNTLWDWLSLLLLPAVVATASVWATTWPPARAHVRIVAVATIALVALAVPGYLVPWKWTGFTGNTAWDWVKLLLLPLAVPIVLLPPVTRYITGRLGAPEGDHGARARRDAPSDGAADGEASVE